ncbi:hypothetical protein Nepgr_012700 [Nepenthes gracilis]|uniref:Uncharacterized protein n=1 Tax=Nepenthes gracilis TaxID=150966 RepID=A0AAD3XNE4_NEPGR|nr:hypothetical protein Nepgr_012700 [Nepenthes gracilis]
MVKSADQKNEQMEKQSSQVKDKALLWDCGSSLYDSFELNSFKQQLDSAISSRSLSMPHLTDRRCHDLPQPPPPPPSKKQTPKLARSLQKLLRSFFRAKQNSGLWFHHPTAQERVRLPDALSTISEVPEVDYAAVSPVTSPFVRKTSSGRFTATSVIGVSA